MGFPSCVALVLATLAVGACRTDADPPLSPACLRGPDAVHAALAQAPGRVSLDGTRISACLAGARDMSDLQNVGAILTRVAEDLEARAPEDPEAALQLGYLAGAARRGWPHTSGPQYELVHRLQRSTALLDARPEAAAALARGLRAGERAG
jgi:hypothetical protein